jgi:predicted phage terminase large subunit-like protein
LFASLVETLYLGLTDESSGTGDVRAARSSLLTFARSMKPDYEPAWFHELLARALDRFVAGDWPRLIICLPPQHGKTELVSRLLPAYLLGREPDTRIIAASYSDDLASRNNLDVQRYIDSPTYAAIFPGTRLAGATSGSMRKSESQFARARRTTKLFEVVGRRGSYRSAGIGTGITGMGADVGIVDDPVKDRKEAESETVRDAIWQWYTSTFLTRLRRPGRVLVTMTRWHEDDLVGKLLRSADDPKADQWRVIRLPAVAEEWDRHADDARPVGEALWPVRYSAASLDNLRATLGGYQFDGMYQQRPSRPGGSVFRRAWFAVEPVSPNGVPGSQRCRFWDVAATEGDGDWTVGARVCRLPDGTIWVEDVIRVQSGPADVEKLIEQTARLDGVAVMIREEQEPGSSGKAVIAARARRLAGWDYKGVPSDENKVLRWRPFAAQAEAGAVKVKQASWTADLLDELERVPGGRHDDQADAVAGAFLALAQRPAASSVARKLAGWG